MMRSAILAALALLTACGTAPQTNRDLERIANDYQREAYAEQRSSTPAPRDACGASENQALIGQLGDAITPPANARVICHNCPATMDFNATRLTIQLGPDGKVATLSCG
ncbi:MAG: I78 family peptidase inhibitor [Hyphomonadaceae bacterium]